MKKLTKKMVKEANDILDKLDSNIREHLEISSKMFGRYVDEGNSIFKERSHGGIIGYIEALEDMGFISGNERFLLIDYFISKPFNS